MAELQDTSGSSPQLRRYQSKGVQIKDAPQGGRGGVVQEADEKMWDSISGSIQKIVDVNVKMNHAALDLEKQTMNGEMQAHYLDNAAKIENNINGFQNGQLSATSFDSAYGKDEGIKIEGQSGVKSFAMSDKYSKKAQEQMAPILALSDKKFKNSVKRMYHEELIKRNADFLNHNETKTLSLLRKQLAEPEGELRDAILKSQEEGGTQLFINSGRVEQHKQTIANNYFREYANVIEGKFDKKLLTRQQADLRMELYGQALGDVYFDHYVAIDPDKAYRLALEDGIVIDGGDGVEPVIYNSEKISAFVLRQRLKEQGELEQGKRDSFVSGALLSIRGGNAKPALEGILEVYNPDGMKQVENPQHKKDPKKYPKFITRKYTDKEKDLLAQAYFEEGNLKDKGYATWHDVKAMLNTLTSKALDNKQSDDARLKREKREKDDKFNFAFFGGISKITANKDLEKRNGQLAKLYNANLETNTWDAKPETLKQLTDVGINQSEAETKLKLAVKGIDPRNPGSGLKSGMRNLQNAIDHYWRGKMFVNSDSNHNTDPMNMPEYKTYLMNSEENGIIANQIKGYEELHDFNQNEIKNLSSKGLAKRWKDLRIDQTTGDQSGSGQRTRALAMLGQEFGKIVDDRVEAMQTDPILVAMADEKIEFDFFAANKDRVPIPESFKKAVNKWYEKIGEPREAIDYTGPGGLDPVYGYLPEAFVLTWYQKMTTPAKLEGVSKPIKGSK
jgi:hypothetical protein